MIANRHHSRLEVTTVMLHAVVLVTVAGLVAADFDPELHAKYLSMPRSSFIEYFNKQDYSWKMTEYDNIEEKYIPCAHFDMESIEKLPLQTHDLEAIDLPDSFDARDKWPQCETIKEIYNQGVCGSCWAFGTAMTASDRTCIHKDVHVSLAEQDFACMQEKVCEGGDPAEAFDFWRNKGLVTQECKPYDIKELNKNKCVTECVTTNISYNEDKHFAENVYRISNNSDQIKAELVKNGPIQAGFNVFTDFFLYEKGVYVHKNGDLEGGHSVRVIGYGVEEGIEFWLVANSWGARWGENGWFKVKSFQEEIDFENYMFTGLPRN